MRFTKTDFSKTKTNSACTIWNHHSLHYMLYIHPDNGDYRHSLSDIICTVMPKTLISSVVCRDARSYMSKWQCERSESETWCSFDASGAKGQLQPCRICPISTIQQKSLRCPIVYQKHLLKSLISVSKGQFQFW